MWMCNVSGMMLMYIRCVGALVWMVQWWEEVWFELKPKFGHGLPPIWTHQIRYQPIPSFHKYSLTILSHADGFTVLFCCSNMLFHPKISGANVCVFRTTGMFIKCTNPNNHPNSLTVSSNVEKLNNCTMLVIYIVWVGRTWLKNAKSLPVLSWNLCSQRSSRRAQRNPTRKHTITYEWLPTLQKCL